MTGKKNTDIRLIVLSWIPALIIMGIIFSFSAKEATASSHTSSQIVDAIVRIVEQLFHHSIAKGSDSYELLHTCIRKLGHLSEYMALGFCLMLPFSVIGLRSVRLVCACELTAALYACSDEFHQLFVKGRDGNLTDVAIDSTGALIGISISLLILVLVKKARKSRD